MFTWPDGFSPWPIETDGTDVVPIVREFFEALDVLDKERTVACMHEDCVCEYPTRTVGVPERLVGRKAFAEYEELSFSVPSRKFDDFEVYTLGDPSWCLLTHTLEHTFPWPGGEFKSSMSSIFGAREGKLIYMREYYDTAALQKALENAPDKFKRHGAEG
jgi:ketosteroid isomerase-like protein